MSLENEIRTIVWKEQFFGAVLLSVKDKLYQKLYV